MITDEDSSTDHLDKLKLVLIKCQEAGLRVNTPKLPLGTDEVEYLGCALTCKGTKPQSEMVSTILAINSPASIKVLRCFLGMVLYCRDMWACRSHLLAPLTDLVGKRGHTIAMEKSGTKK